MMLVHIGQGDVAERVHNAWLATIEAGVKTADIARGGPSVGTMDFARAVVERLGTVPQQLQPVRYDTVVEQELPDPAPARMEEVRPEPERELDGVDVFLYNVALSADELGHRLERLAGPEFKLALITNRGVKVYPGGFPETFCTDHWRCRFQASHPERPVNNQDICSLLGRIAEDGLEWIKLENLYRFDGEVAYSLGQGQ